MTLLIIHDCHGSGMSTEVPGTLCSWVTAEMIASVPQRTIFHQTWKNKSSIQLKIGRKKGGNIGEGYINLSCKQRGRKSRRKERNNSTLIVWWTHPCLTQSILWKTPKVAPTQWQAPIIVRRKGKACRAMLWGSLASPVPTLPNINCTWAQRYPRLAYLTPV